MTRNVHQSTARALETWAAQKRLMYIGAEGFASRSVLGKIRDEAEGASQTQKPAVERQRWLEVYHGDGLAVERIVHTMPGPERMTLTCYYLFKHPIHVPIEEQCLYIGSRTRQYWEDLSRAELVVNSGLQLLPADAESSAHTFRPMFFEARA